jgi:UDP-sugar pyrophosphorylase
MKCITGAAGDVNDASGYSPFPGSINQLVLKLSTYERQLTATGGVIAEFVNPKFKDSGRTAFKKPTRFDSVRCGNAVGSTVALDVGQQKMLGD